MPTWCEPVSAVAVRVEGLGKRYAVGGGAPYLSLRDSLAALPRRLLGRARGRRGHAELWVLRDVSFEVQQGEVLGIIGRNGAGKSTLLKILSRITRPTTGRAEVWGRVGSLLEIGTGFHPELSGRENIWLYGAILGLKRHEIQKKFDEIVAFCGVETFLDMPIKHYSSGMQMRLAFSVAAHLEPEVLLVDEVLAVGDAAFQRKCLGKMEDVQKSGRTVLFVSHNMAAVETLCSRTLLMDGGRLVCDGDTASVIARYTESRSNSQLAWKRTTPAQVPAYFEEVRLTARGTRAAGFTTAATIIADIWVQITKTICDLQMSVDLLTSYDQIIFVSVPQDDDVEMPRRPGLYHLRLILPPELLLPRAYTLRVNLYLPGVGGLDRVEDLRFSVERAAGRWVNLAGERLGLVFLPCRWELQQATALPASDASSAC